MAGFYVVGVDNRPQPHYCGDEFIQADAIEFIRSHGHEYDAIHASPPCQGYSRTKNLKTSRTDHAMLVESTREVLRETNRAYVIENVQGAPLINPLLLCGSMFGLGVIRHRLFECNPPIWFPPTQCNHVGKVLPMWWKSRRVAIERGEQFAYVTVAGNSYLMPEARLAMGIEWMVRSELSQAIPPAYTEWIGRQLLEYLAV